MICDQDLDFTHVFGGPIHSVDFFEVTDPIHLHPYPSLDSATQSPPIPVLSFTVANGACELSSQPEVVEGHSLDVSGTTSPSNMHSYRSMGAGASTRSNAKEVAYTDGASIPVCKIPNAAHMCDFAGCKNKTAFKRREHLQRH
ncbi:uncharacterized protein PG986_014434 [Apiospora aurea]|uniref:C2H2-type domain-containing protein n=1 Tax=Apiospora aurea TaxID=335848 RepID=A0ABR1PSZ0_9PEZI